MRRKLRIVREHGKIRLELNPPAGEFAQALAHMRGNRKPGRGAFNWRVNGVLLSDQIGGIKRHLARIMDGEDLDDEGVEHLGAIMARSAIILDARQHGTLIDDRVKRARRRK